MNFGHKLALCLFVLLQHCVAQSVTLEDVKRAAANVKKGINYEEAITIAQEGMQGDDMPFQAAIQLWDVLFDKNKGYQEALSTAQQSIKSFNDNIQARGLILFLNLVKKEKYYQEALVAAEKLAINRNSFVVQEALNLFSMLFKNKIGYQEAINLAQQNWDHSWTYVRDATNRLIDVLFKSLEEALQDKPKALTTLTSLKKEYTKKETKKVLQGLTNLVEMYGLTPKAVTLQQALENLVLKLRELQKFLKDKFKSSTR